MRVRRPAGPTATADKKCAKESRSQMSVVVAGNSPAAFWTSGPTSSIGLGLLDGSHAAGVQAVAEVPPDPTAGPGGPV